MIDPCLHTIAAPTSTISKLLADNVIFERNTTTGTDFYPFVAKCDAEITLKFSFGKNEFVLGSLVNVSTRIDDGSYIAFN
jgi:hypothetical protein